MATRTKTLTAATIGQVTDANLQRDSEGEVVIAINVASDGSDKRTILLSETSLTPAERAAFVNAWATILADLQAQDPAYA